jgi:hypothetical protein
MGPCERCYKRNLQREEHHCPTFAASLQLKILLKDFRLNTPRRRNSRAGYEFEGTAAVFGR